MAKKKRARPTKKATKRRSTLRKSAAARGRKKAKKGAKKAVDPVRSAAAKKAWERRRIRERKAERVAERKRKARAEARRKAKEKREREKAVREREERERTARRKAAAKKAAATRAANKRAREEAAKKAAETRARNKAKREKAKREREKIAKRDRERRAAAARKGWATRRKKEAKKPRKPKKPPEVPPPIPPKPVIVAPTEATPADQRSYIKEVLSSACDELRESMGCEVRTHLEGDGSVSAELKVPVFGLNVDEIQQALLAISESLRFGPMKNAFVSVGFRVDTGSALSAGADYKLPNRGTYNRATYYHDFDRFAYAMLAASSEVLPNLMGNPVEVVLRIRWVPKVEYYKGPQGERKKVRPPRPRM
jgi:hypothetical protein